MKLNVHYIDRIVRVLLGATLLAFFFFGNSDYKIFALLGFIPLITGLIGFCPIYSLLGINGCACKRSET